MALNINGTTGISGVDGSASAPALTGTDSNTGINFGTDTVNINTGGVTRATVDSAGRLLIGTATEGHEEGDDLTIATSGVTGFTIRSGTSSAGNIFFSDATSGSAERQGIIRYDHSDDAMKFNINNAERMRIDSSGRILLNTTSAYAGSAVVLAKATGGAGVSVFNSWNTADSGTRYHFEFRDS